MLVRMLRIYKRVRTYFLCALPCGGERGGGTGTVMKTNGEVKHRGQLRGGYHRERDAPVGTRWMADLRSGFLARCAATDVRQGKAYPCWSCRSLRRVVGQRELKEKGLSWWGRACLGDARADIRA